MADKSNSFASGRFFDSDGQMVSLSWDLDGTIDDFDDEQAQKVHQVVAIMRRNGFSTTAPDAKEGEKIFDVWYVVQRGKINDDNSETPIIDFYAQHEKMNFKYFSHYLNTPEDKAAFQEATGLNLENIKMFEGESALQKESPKFKQFCVECPKHPKVALVPNSYYNPDEPDVKKRKAQFKFSRWMGIAVTGAGDDPKATSGSAGNASGKNAASGKTDIQAHWSTDNANRQRIIAAFEAAGANSREAMIAAMQIIETGVTKLGESKAKSIDEYISWITTRYTKLGQNLSGTNDLSKNNAYGKQPGETFVDELGEIHIIQADGTDFIDHSDADENLLDEAAAPDAEEWTWTKETSDKFTQEILETYPSITRETLFLEIAIKNWIGHPNAERVVVAGVAKELGWNVRTEKVGYFKGVSKDKSYIIFFTPVGEINFYKGTTEFMKLVGGGWARANNVSEWRELTQPRAIEPLALVWQTRNRESDGSEYLEVIGVEKTDNLDQVLEGDDPLR